MSDIFINSEIQRPPKPYNNNKCPPGHYISIQAGGNGHNVNVLMKTKFNITSVFSAEKLNGNSAKQLL